MEEFCPHEQPCALPVNNDDDDDGDEALSLSDLPLIHQSTMQIIDGEEDRSLERIEAQDDFDFCAMQFKDSEMCAADDVFFQGQILPLRRSIGSADGLSLCHPSISRSRSMDCRDSGALTASRSNSTSSHSSSGSSAADKPPNPSRNLFHSHPSPSPKIQTTGKIHNRNCTIDKSSSSAWSIFRLGLLATPPEIVFHNPKTRTNCRNRNSASAGCGNSSNTTVGNSDKKKAPRVNFLGGCDCSLGAVDTVPSKVVIYKRSTSDGETENAPKKRVSHHRMFEWLKQLSIESTPDLTGGNQP